VTSAVFPVVLPVVLALVVFGLGPALTIAHVARVLAVPGPCSSPGVPGHAPPGDVLRLVVGVRLEPDLAIGMMRLRKPLTAPPPR
jgi:hypothetical protein